MCNEILLSNFSPKIRSLVKPGFASSKKRNKMFCIFSVARPCDIGIKKNRKFVLQMLQIDLVSKIAVSFKLELKTYRAG